MPQTELTKWFECMGEFKQFEVGTPYGVLLPTTP